ncbi:transcriptional repressor NrdR [Sphingomonas lacunae]|uniref:Transcriptional repressor NrdR n=1 Tax=Sphingomonas lacunae TaxID=2698828 RepID=A0A6M4AUE2_9SPHN|nr:transcriptional regulator NrdR [Sphingomonas lacunae]QJQ32703.1 transcriptional repressor NrdR [Sphingomonas lacunae]
MKCPACGHEDSQVKDSRPTEDGAAIRRRRQCEKCEARFTTFERIQLREVTVVKTNGQREPFDRDKLLRSVAIACRKRPIDTAGIDRLVSTIQRALETQGDAEVSTQEIGARVMEALKSIDSVAYIRFASVYRDFAEARDFEEFAASIRDISGE